LKVPLGMSAISLNSGAGWFSLAAPQDILTVLGGIG
jgi:hypothetical protein